MRRNILTIIYIVLLIFLIFFIQLYMINPRELFGVKPNLILILSIVISLWFGIYVGGISSFCLGIVTDILFSSVSMGMFTISYTIVGIVVGTLNNNYRKESKMSLVYVTIIATFVFEIVQSFCYLIFFNAYTNIFYLLKQIIISSLLNIVIVYIIYSIIFRITEYIEDRIIQNASGL